MTTHLGTKSPRVMRVGFVVLLFAVVASATSPWDDVARRNPHAKFGPTRFSNMTEAQWRSLQGGGKWPKNISDAWTTSTPVHALPTAKDWSNVLTPIKDQGTCGSCWVHAAVEQVEAYSKIAGSVGNPGTPLSVQQVTSCMTTIPSAGNCNGGNFEYAASYIQTSGLMTEDAYPYKSGSLGCGFGGTMGSNDFCVTSEMGSSGRCLSLPNHCPVPDTALREQSSICFDGQCDTQYFGCCLTTAADSAMHSNMSTTQRMLKPLTDMPINTGAQCLYNSGAAATKITGHNYVAADETAMQSWLAEHGPLQISVDATDLNSYQSGVMTSCTPGQIDHDVQLVGYGTDSGIDYWRIRNSWGASWGEAGYFRVKRGVNSCSMASQVAGYPEVQSA